MILPYLIPDSGLLRILLIVFTSLDLAPNWWVARDFSIEVPGLFGVNPLSILGISEPVKEIASDGLPPFPDMARP